MAYIPIKTHLLAPKVGSERGAALVEFAIAVPIVLLLTAIVIALGSLLLAYHRMSEVAYEGARLATKTNGLEIKTGQTLGITCTQVAAVVYAASGSIQTIVVPAPAACAGASAYLPTVTSQHQQVHDRVNTLMALERFGFNTNQGGWSTRVEYNSASQEVVVSLSASYPFFWGFSGSSFPLNVSTSLPYLAE